MPNDILPPLPHSLSLLTKATTLQWRIDVNIRRI
jgi:hypothetical protein